jgi:hypothetical protein
MAAPRFVTNAAGERTDVILDISTYERLLASKDDADLLLGLTKAELEALAHSQLASIDAQALQDLGQKASSANLNPEEAEQLDSQLEHIDQLNILKARACYTLKNLFHTPPE